ncbi:MAG: hypothetical protein BWY31_01587 [Lentisphaerae bacterium ADurb.Bin242]|nr:MAG: hypothetical protein BWY31_01587 [Lentisphaerae bacterium ADurb.Bin242]
MKNILLTCLCAAGLALNATEKTFSMNAVPAEKIFQVNAPLKVKLESSCPDGYSVKAWRLVAYVPNIPNNFSSVTGAKVNPNKLKEWSTVTIMAWNWEIPGDGILVKSTDKWPEGDYKMSLFILFTGKTPDGKKLPDKMLSQDILFTLKTGNSFHVQK